MKRKEVEGKERYCYTSPNTQPKKNSFPDLKVTYLLGLILSKLSLTASHTVSTLLFAAAGFTPVSVLFAYAAAYRVCVVSSSLRSVRTKFRLVAESNSLTKRSMLARNACWDKGILYRHGIMMITKRTYSSNVVLYSTSIYQ